MYNLLHLLILLNLNENKFDEEIDLKVKLRGQIYQRENKGKVFLIISLNESSLIHYVVIYKIIHLYKSHDLLKYLNKSYNLLNRAYTNHIEGDFLGVNTPWQGWDQHRKLLDRVLGPSTNFSNFVTLGSTFLGYLGMHKLHSILPGTLVQRIEQQDLKGCKSCETLLSIFHCQT